MGSIVGGLYSAGVSLDEIQEMLYDKSLRKAYFPGAIPPKLILSPLLKVTHPFGSKTYAGLWTGDKFKKYLNAHLPKPDMDITETKIPFSAVATNLIDGNAYRISEGPLARAIVASAAISPIIKPVPIDDKIYVDGGVRANLPASSAKETGADVVIAVLVDEPLKDLPAKKFKHLAGIASRLADIILAVADERQLEFADVVINPDVTGVPVLSNRSKDVLIAEKAGEAAAEKAMPAILKKLRESKHNERVAKGGQVHGSAH
jgi:NTE family protein